MRKQIQRGEALVLGHTAGNWQSCGKGSNKLKLMLEVWEVGGYQKHKFLGTVSDYKILNLVLGKFTSDWL